MVDTPKDELVVKNARPEDLDKVVELENQIWPEGTRASREKFEKRLELFRDGFFIVYKNGEIIGVSTSEIFNYNPQNPPKSWELVTDNGFIERTHNPKGNALYVVSVGALSRSGGGSALVQAQKKLVQKLNLEFLVLGARIPGYDAYCQENAEIPIEEYVQLRRGEGLMDSELRFYTRNGLSLDKIMPNYMEDDKESRNYGAIMVWKNPDYQVR